MHKQEMIRRVADAMERAAHKWIATQPETSQLTIADVSIDILAEAAIREMRGPTPHMLAYAIPRIRAANSGMRELAREAVNLIPPSLTNDTDYFLSLSSITDMIQDWNHMVDYAAGGERPTLRIAKPEDE